MMRTEQDSQIVFIGSHLPSSDGLSDLLYEDVLAVANVDD